MFIKIDAAIISEETEEEAKLLGKTEFSDDEVMMIERRVNPEYILAYEQMGEDDSQSIIYFVGGTEMWCQNGPSELDAKLKHYRKQKLLVMSQ